MLKSIEEVCNELPHFGTITPDGINDVEIWAKPLSLNLEEYQVPGIYCIENFRANKIYIGMSKNVAERIKIERRELRPDTGVLHHNSKMCEDSKIYGFESFSFGILETFEEYDYKSFLKREEDWMRYFENQSPNCLYNKIRITPSKYMELEMESVEELPKVPIDWLIQDVLQMKVEAHNIQNKKLFKFADYLEKRLFEYKNGEIDFCREVPR